MRVCHESRNEALLHLKLLTFPALLKSENATSPGTIVPAHARGYFNSVIDTILLVDLPTRLPWDQSWRAAIVEGDFSYVRKLAIDRRWLSPNTNEFQFEHLVRMLGRVEDLHVVSLNEHWNLAPWCQWHCSGRLDVGTREEFTWVDMEEVKGRPVGGVNRIWANAGEDSLMAVAGGDALSLDGAEAFARRNEVVKRLEEERVLRPERWKVPRVELGFVRYDRVQKEYSAPRSNGLLFHIVESWLFVSSIIGRLKKWTGSK